MSYIKGSKVQQKFMIYYGTVKFTCTSQANLATVTDLGFKSQRSRHEHLLIKSNYSETGFERYHK